MKFILDANIPYSAKRIFRKPLKVVHVRDLGLADAADHDIIQRALREGAVLVTRDLDFANTILHPIGTHAGVIVLRVPPHFIAGSINQVLQHFLAVADINSLVDAVTIVEPGRYRMRR